MKPILLKEKFREDSYIVEDAKIKLAGRFSTTPEFISIRFQNRRAQQLKASRSKRESSTRLLSVKTRQVFSLEKKNTYGTVVKTKWSFTSEYINRI